MFWMRAYPLRGEVGGGCALEFSSFLGPVKRHRADRRVPFGPAFQRTVSREKFTWTNYFSVSAKDPINVNFLSVINPNI
jgi:hypothetical protein